MARWLAAAWTAIGGLALGVVVGHGEAWASESIRDGPAPSVCGRVDSRGMVREGVGDVLEIRFREGGEGEWRSTPIEKDGRFCVRMPTGRAPLEITSVVSGFPRLMRRAGVQAGLPGDDLLLELPLIGVGEARVKDSSGKPVEGDLDLAYFRETAPGIWATMAEGTLRTGAGGEARVAVPSLEARVALRFRHVSAGTAAVPISPFEEPAELDVTLSGVDEAAGRIIAEHTGKGVPDAEIELRCLRDGLVLFSGHEKSTTDGLFRFSRVPRGQCVLDVRHAELQPLHRTVEVGAVSSRQLFLALQHGVEVRGIVVDAETGAAIEEATVKVVGENRDETTAITDETGMFRLSGFGQDGYLFLKAERAGFESATHGIDLSDLPSELQLIELGRGVDWVIWIEGLTGLRARVSLRRRSVTFSVEGPVDEPLRLAHGPTGWISYDVYRADSAAGHSLCGGRVDAVPDRSGVVELEIDCGRDHAVAGRVLTASGVPVPDAPFVLEADDRDGSQRLFWTDPHGHFELGVGNPGDYTIRGLGLAGPLFGSLWRGRVPLPVDIAIQLPEEFMEIVEWQRQRTLVQPHGGSRSP